MAKPEEQQVEEPPRCLSCNATSSRHLRTGPDGPRTLCDRCSQRYGKHRLRLFQARDGRVSARWHPGSIPVISVDFGSGKSNKRLHKQPIVRPASPSEHHQLTLRRRPGRPPRSSYLINNYQDPASGSSSPETQPQVCLPKKEELVEPAAAPAPMPASPPAALRNLPCRAAKDAANARNAAVLANPRLPYEPSAPPLHIARPRTPSPGPSAENSVYLGKRKGAPEGHHVVYKRLAQENQRAGSDQDVKTNHSASDFLLHHGRAFVPFVPVGASGSGDRTPFKPNGIMIKVELKRVLDTQVSCVRILAIPSAYSWCSLKVHLRRAFRVLGPFSVTYRDRAGDTIALSSDLDMPGLFYVASLLGLIHLNIIEMSSSPTPS